MPEGQKDRSCLDSRGRGQRSSAWLLCMPRRRQCCAWKPSPPPYNDLAQAPQSIQMSWFAPSRTRCLSHHWGRGAVKGEEAESRTVVRGTRCKEDPPRGVGSTSPIGSPPEMQAGPRQRVWVGIWTLSVDVEVIIKCGSSPVSPENRP